MTCIAVVDDDPQCADLIADVLEFEGWQTLKYYQSDGAISLLRQAHPDLIILDVYIEQRDSGWLLLDLLQVDPLTSAIPILVCTADTAQLQTRGGWLEEQRIPVLAKPFDLDDLLNLVRSALADARSSSISVGAQ